MGTRHHQVVIDKEGNMKVMQYGQWDGYPSGQGIDILKFLRSSDLEKYQEKLSKVREINKDEIAIVEKDKNWPKKYPFLSRDCGSEIHQMIQDGKVSYVSFCSMEKAEKLCEGFYTIDFQKNEFTAEYHSSVRTWSLNDLPSDKDFINAFDTNEE